MAAPEESLIRTPDGKNRCWWCGTDADYVAYHDDEWGMPVGDDQRLFEKMCLEGFQAGLSWLTILRKREAFRNHFHGFDFSKVARFDKTHVETMLADAAIIRHRGKINSVINNAARAIEMTGEFGSIANFFWSFEPQQQQPIRSRSEIPAITDESTAMSKALKKRGWTFVGPTTCYALMQAMGMVNDHLPECEAYDRVQSARDAFVRP